MSWWQALFMGLLQGATELFPVSSLGHAVLLPSILHWSFKQSDPSFVPFLVLLHLGTAGALLILYRKEWVELIVGFFRAAFRGRIDMQTFDEGREGKADNGAGAARPSAAGAASVAEANSGRKPVPRAEPG